MGNKIYKKRIFNVVSLIEQSNFFIQNINQVQSTLTSGRISREFSEKIMLTVIKVNQCRYCQWFHTDLANKAGTSQVEIEDILEHDFTNISDDEKPALIYAAHYAETNQSATIEMKTDLINYYGKEKANDIEVYLKIIFFGNLSGNTFDAFLARQKGYDIPNSSIIFESLFFVLSALPLLSIAAFTKNGRNPLVSHSFD